MLFHQLYACAGFQPSAVPCGRATGTGCGSFLRFAQVFVIWLAGPLLFRLAAQVLVIWRGGPFAQVFVIWLWHCVAQVFVIWRALGAPVSVQTVLGGLAWFHHSILSCCGSCGNPTPAESVLPSARVRSRWWPASVWLLRLAPPLASPAWMDAPRFSPSPLRRTSPVLVAAARGAAASSAGVCCGCLGRSLLQGYRPLARPGLGVPAFRLASPPPALLRNSFPGWSVTALLRYSLPGWR